jgi:hypothetical protein
MKRFALLCAAALCACSLLMPVRTERDVDFTR